MWIQKMEKGMASNAVNSGTRSRSLGSAISVASGANLASNGIINKI